MTASQVTHDEFVQFLSLLSHHARENLTYELAKLRAKQLNIVSQARKTNPDFEPDDLHNNHSAYLEKLNDILEVVKEEAGPAPPEDDNPINAAIQAGVKHEE